eukprot:9210480-Pyramimonas_sp.AAC.1
MIIGLTFVILLFLLLLLLPSFERFGRSHARGPGAPPAGPSGQGPTLTLAVYTTPPACGSLPMAGGQSAGCPARGRPGARTPRGGRSPTTALGETPSGQPWL